MERQQEGKDEAAAQEEGASLGDLDALSNKQIFDTKAAFRWVGGWYG